MGAELVLFTTCLEDTLFPDVSRAARRVLTRLGFEVTAISGPACCGQPAWNAGHIREAARVAGAARKKILEGEGPIVACSGSCVSMIKEYWPEIFASQGPGDEAAQVGDRVQEFSSFVAGATSGTDRIGAIPPRSISYHDSCSCCVCSASSHRYEICCRRSMVWTSSSYRLPSSVADSAAPSLSVIRNSRAPWPTRR